MRASPEKKVEAACDRLMGTLGYDALRFSQARATMQTPGIPDRKYYRRGHTFWFEAKAEGGVQSDYQKAFQLMAEAAGEDYVMGGIPELVTYLSAKGICRMLPSGGIEHPLWRSTAQRGPTSLIGE